MKKMFLMPLLLSSFAVGSLLAATTGSVTFTVKTKPTKEKYAPRNVVAIWVTNAEGDFIKTLAVHAKKRKKYLKIWAKQSKKDITDAVTGATLKTDQLHTVKWDCCDVKGNPVADGDYEIHIEFTNGNKQGPVTPAGHIKFTKGAAATQVEPEKLPCFEMMKLDYTPNKGS